jgi:hypothetical protein
MQSACEPVSVAKFPDNTEKMQRIFPIQATRRDFGAWSAGEVAGWTALSTVKPN